MKTSIIMMMINSQIYIPELLGQPLIITMPFVPRALSRKGPA